MNLADSVGDERSAERTETVLERKEERKSERETNASSFQSSSSVRTHHGVPDPSPEGLFLSLPVSTSDHEESRSDDGLADTGRTRSKSALLSTRHKFGRQKKAHPRKVRQRAKSVKFFPCDVTARTIPQRTTCQKEKKEDHDANRVTFSFRASDERERWWRLTMVGTYRLIGSFWRR